MSTQESLAFLVLWVVAIALFALVISLYRLVDRAYSGSESSATANALKPGTVIPAIEVLTPDGIRELEPSPNGRSLLVFARSDCHGCELLAEGLRGVDVDATVLLIEGARYPSSGPTLPSHVRVAALAYPRDTPEEFGVATVPLVFALQGQTVLAAGSPTSEREINALMREAEVNLEGLSPTRQE